MEIERQREKKPEFEVDDDIPIPIPYILGEVLCDVRGEGRVACVKKRRGGEARGRGETATAKTGHDRHGYGSYVEGFHEKKKKMTEVWEIMGDETSGVCDGKVRDGDCGLAAGESGRNRKSKLATGARGWE